MKQNAIQNSQYAINNGHAYESKCCEKSRLPCWLCNSLISTNETSFGSFTQSRIFSKKNWCAKNKIASFEIPTAQLTAQFTLNLNGGNVMKWLISNEDMVNNVC